MQKRHHSRNRTRCNQITLISIWKANTNLFMFTPWWSFFPVSHHLLLTSRRVARQTIFLELHPALPGSLLSGSLLFSQRPSLDSWFWNHSRNNCAFCPWCYRAEWIDAHTEMRCHILRTNEGHGRKLLFFFFMAVICPALWNRTTVEFIFCYRSNHPIWAAASKNWDFLPPNLPLLYLLFACFGCTFWLYHLFPSRRQRSSGMLGLKGTLPATLEQQASQQLGWGRRKMRTMTRTSKTAKQSLSQSSEPTGHFQHPLISQEETPPRGSAEGTASGICP